MSLLEDKESMQKTDLVFDALYQKQAKTYGCFGFNTSGDILVQHGRELLSEIEEVILNEVVPNYLDDVFDSRMKYCGVGAVLSAYFLNCSDHCRAARFLERLQGDTLIIALHMLNVHFGPLQRAPSEVIIPREFKEVLLKISNGVNTNAKLISDQLLPHCI